MGQPVRLFALSGSLRSGSYNTRLIRLAAAEARRQGAQVVLGDFRALAPPLYDADLEAASGFPPPAQALIAALEQAEAVMISTPEYNASVPGTLKNAFDWVSRVKPYRLADKPLLLMGASGGRGGALQGMAALRITLAYQGAAIFTDGFSLANGKSAFDEQDGFADTALNDKLAELIGRFLRSVEGRRQAAAEGDR